MNILTDGRFAALQGSSLVMVDPASGKLDAVQTEADFSGLFAVSPTGTLVATLADPKTVRLYSLTGGAPLDIPIAKSERPDKLVFGADGTTIVLQFYYYTNNYRVEVYDTGTAKQLSTNSITGTAGFSSDAKYFVIRANGGSIAVFDIVTGKAISSIPGGKQIARGCSNGACVDDIQHIDGFFVVGGPQTSVVIWDDINGKKPDDGSQWTMSDYVTTYTTYIEDLTTGVQKFIFDGYTLDNVDAGLSAPDGSAFVLIKTDGEVFVHSLKDAKVIAKTDRYSIGSAPQLSPDGKLVGWANLKGVAVYDWQNAKSVLDKPQPLIVTAANFVGFLADGRLLSEGTPKGGVGLDIWNVANGSVDSTIPALSDCSADTAGAYVLCTVPSTQARRILALANPDKIVFSTNDPNITAISPVGDSYVTCKPGDGSIKYKKYDAPGATLKQPCQPMFYKPDGTALVLQSGVVVTLPTR